MLHEAHRDTSRLLVPEAEANGVWALSPSERHLAFSYRTPDSSQLALFDLTTRTLQTIHSENSTVKYSLAWHPKQDRLAFGHYRPREDGGRGAGGIRIAKADGSTRTVGCSAAREVLDWLPNGSLATRTDDNLYVVSTSDCATRASRDARRMHHISYAPDGSRMAYIHRELKYDRDAGDYVPDSSLVLAPVRGTTTETLLGDSRKVRHHRWAPDASELAFDVRVPESEHRQIAVYNGERTVFLTPPDETTKDQVQPRWSPSGDRLAFTQRTMNGAHAAVRVKGTTRQLGPLDGPVWGWIGERKVVVPGPDSVRIQTITGTTQYSRPAPRSLVYVWTEPIS